MKAGTNVPLTFTEKVTRKIFGKPRDITDPHIFHKLSLIPLLAWIGLGADGLSSSAYGPEEAFRTLGTHTYLALFLVLAAAVTVIIISYAYSKIIEHFPFGGGGYIVATHMLGKGAGVVSGCALIVDYILTITVSIVSCVDALFSFIPVEYQRFKIFTSAALIVLLITLNIRGVKESIAILAPIFMAFLVTHAVMLIYGIFGNIGNFKPIMQNFHSSIHTDTSTIGLMGIFVILLRAYSLGGGTYTGIEAVSNGLQIMREPKVQTGKRTMFYMASSLALTAGGLLLCYLLCGVRPAEGRTLNSILADALFGNWPLGPWIALITILSEGALLLVAAQAGFIDAPRVMANMAVDSWLPHRFSFFSERLTMRNGIILIGTCAMIVLFYTHGSIVTLVVMYSINVFLTFSLSELGMAWFFLSHRRTAPGWIKQFLIQAVALVFCVTILSITIFEKFSEGGWITVLITSVLIVICWLTRRHYSRVRADLMQLDKILTKMPASDSVNTKPIDKNDMTAIQLVSNFNGFGVHTLFSIIRSFQGLYKNFVFVSVAVVDQGAFKGKEGLDDLKKSTEESLKKYVELARIMGYPAEYRMVIGTDVIDSATELCQNVSKEFAKSTVFSGRLAFRFEKFYHRLLHNDTAFAVQRRLQWSSITNVILPIRIQM